VNIVCAVQSFAVDLAWPILALASLITLNAITFTETAHRQALPLPAEADSRQKPPATSKRVFLEEMRL
jgi:hypothetical protein